MTGGGTITYLRAEEAKQKKLNANMDTTEEESEGEEAVEETEDGAESDTDETGEGASAPPTTSKSRVSHTHLHCTPDFSKVEARVRLPKEVYKPPASRHCAGADPLFSETPATFMSPADIVKAVLLNNTEGAPDISAVPREFRSKEQAISLVEQLQEAHQRLLLENAEAKNTIDHLRLTAKINLYSDPPKPHLMLSSSLSRDSSQMLNLSLAHAQQAEVTASSSRDHHPPPPPHPGGQGAPQSSTAGQPLSDTLYHHADSFIQQLQTFQDLLKAKQLTKSEQMDGLSHLNKELQSLENAYLFERDEHRLRQWRGEEVSEFDPEREVEGLIFQCECRMDEMKERVEQMRQEEPVCEPPPTPPPRPTPSSVRSEGGATLSRPQSPLLPLLVDQGPAAELELDSSDEGLDEETALNFMYLNPRRGQHSHEEDALNALADYYQSFQDLPRTFEYSLREETFFSAPSETQVVPEDQAIERSRNEDVSSQRTPGSHHQAPPPTDSLQQSSQSSSLSGGSSSSTKGQRPPGSRVRTESRRFHGNSNSSSSRSSRGGNAAPEQRKRNFSQDGITSPGTDSGFVGSLSNLTPEAAVSPVHQRASQSDSVQEEADTGNALSISASSASTSPPPSHHSTANSAEEPAPLDPEQSSRQRPKRHAHFSSPQRWATQTEGDGDGGGATEDSDSTPSLSEDTQSDSCSGSNQSLHSSHLSSSPAAAMSPPPPDDPLTDLGSRVVANQTALQTLQAEVCRLEHRLGGLARTPKPPSCSSHAPPPPQDSHPSPYTSSPRIILEERPLSDTNGESPRVDPVGEFVLRQTARSPLVVDALQARIGLEPERPESQSTPRLSRCTQTSSAATGSRTSLTNKRTQTRLRPAPCVRFTPDEPDTAKNQCSECLSRRSAWPAGGSSESTSSHHCPLCGFLSTYNSTNTDCRRPTSCQSIKSPDRAERRTASSSLSGPRVEPQFLSTRSAPEPKSRREGGRRKKRRARRYQSADDLSSLDGALDRAIRAARQMRDTSAHMASSLASGLRYQTWLSQSSGPRSQH